jgi:hypothetical protein
MYKQLKKTSIECFTNRLWKKEHEGQRTRLSNYYIQILVKKKKAVMTTIAKIYGTFVRESTYKSMV